MMLRVSYVSIEDVFKYDFLLVMLLGFKHVIEYGPSSYEIFINNKHNGSLDVITQIPDLIYKIDSLFNGISLVKYDGTAMVSSVGVVKGKLNMSKI